MKLSIAFKAAGESITSLNYTIENCPDKVAKEIKKLMSLPNISNVQMTTKELVKMERGLIRAMSKLVDNHPGKDDKVTVSLALKTE